MTLHQLHSRSFWVLDALSPANTPLCLEQILSHSTSPRAFFFLNFLYLLGLNHQRTLSLAH
jgi:hypothetical protein